MEFNGKNCKIGVAAPPCRGAEYPEFNPLKINESRIPDGMRFKEWSARQDGEKRFTLEWMTQTGWDDEDLDTFLKEIKRWGEAWELHDVTCELHLQDRDYETEIYREICWKGGQDGQEV